MLAPMAGGPSTPELAAAVCRAGGLGFLAAGYLSTERIAEQIAAVRAAAGQRPFGVNLFVPGEGPSSGKEYEPYAERLRKWARTAGHELGEPRFSDDEWQAKLELLERAPVPAVSFTFGCPPQAAVRSLHEAGSEVWVTVTHPEEARQAVAAGADALVVQGAEAGGHRASFVDRPGVPVISLLPLLGLVRRSVRLPLVASGGIADGRAVGAVLAAGARAAQVGTAFMLAPEAGTSPAHRDALRTEEPTMLTRAFSGRLARGIANQFAREHGDVAPVAYPEVHYLTAPLRARARQEGNAELINLWAGEAHGLARELPAAEIVARLATEAHQALEEGLRHAASGLR